MDYGTIASEGVARLIRLNGVRFRRVRTGTGLDGFLLAVNGGRESDFGFVPQRIASLRVAGRGLAGHQGRIHVILTTAVGGGSFGNAGLGALGGARRHNSFCRFCLFLVRTGGIDSLCGRRLLYCRGGI